ncbi:uncharacterized protein B0H18DRAFT_962509 [Fomitopsis serialis]|uniref:uncharacterized protein n=1 Tax=Fomitopsis serialis TaxID=139415 RepID=UPI002007B044|nr:uncharacterized protein B0H18DRAFT_962509 [Neoantrodia serialis]KAH9911134.1 hypothetical protein B0H18DRAFT_962509 [Neoantrodia serialis]
MSAEVLQTEQLHGNYHLGKVSDVIKTYRIYGQSAGIKRVTLRVKRNALMSTEAYYSWYSATKEPVAEIQTQPKTSAACQITANSMMLGPGPPQRAQADIQLAVNLTLTNNNSV